MSMTHDITAATARYKRRLRVGRGEGSGHGKTCGRGTKGAGARTGKPNNPLHEGGQTRIYRRLPKRGFSNDDFAHDFYVVNLAELERFSDGSTVDAGALVEAKLIPDTKFPVKILGDGEISKKLTVVAAWYSKSAQQKITAAGGVAQNAKGGTFEFPKPKKKFVKREQPKKEKAEKAPKAEAGAPAAEAPKTE